MKTENKEPQTPDLDKIKGELRKEIKQEFQKEINLLTAVSKSDLKDYINSGSNLYISKEKSRTSNWKFVRGRPFDFWGGRGGGGWFGLVVKFFFNTLIHNEIFFFEYSLANYFFRPPTFCRNFFFCVDGVEKEGIHYCCSLRSQQSYLTQIGARFSLSCSSTAQPSKGARWLMCQTTHV